MLDDRSYMRVDPGGHRFSLTVWLIIINAVAYLLQQILLYSQSGTVLVVEYLTLSPTGMGKGFLWQLITFQFLHGGPFHLAINCLMLYMFGRPVEDTLGRNSYLKLYLLSGVCGGLFQVLGGILWPANLGGSVVGASAGVFGLIAAFAAINPERPLTLLIAFILPVTIKAKYLILAELILSFLGIVSSGRDGIAHGAHLGGILCGLAYIQYVATGRIKLPNLPSLRWPGQRGGRKIVDVRPTKEVFWKKPKPGPPPLEDLPPSDFISREVDPILDKIAEHGIHSLTSRERKILESARSKMSGK